MLCVLVAGVVVVGRAAGPFGVAVARAQGGPPDCDADGDPDTDQNEFSECYQPPPPPPHPFDEGQKISFQATILGAWNACASQGTPVPFPPQLPGQQAPSDPALQAALQVQYTILSAEFLSICGPAGGIGAWAAQMLSVDPPDPLFNQVPAPKALPGTRSLSGRCKRVKPRFRRPCERLATDALSYANDVRQEASLAEVMAIAANRFAYARKLGDTAPEVADAAALDGYSGELALALGMQNHDADTLAKLIRRERLDVHFSARELRALRAGLKNLKGLPRWLIARIKSDYLSVSQIRAMLAKQLKNSKIGPLDLVTLLRRQTPTTGLTAAWDSISLPQLAGLVAGLTSTGVISPQLNIVLNDDLQNAQLACDPSGRTNAVMQLISDAASKLSGPYSTLLQVAARPLLTYHPPASNTPPIAGFLFFPDPASAGSSVFFSDSSTDPDGGHIACRSWNFGDPASGAANTSTDANPTHTYATAGTYTVTLTVTDDDGFATNMTSQTITVN
jgi:hypothetical protein